MSDRRPRRRAPIRRVGRVAEAHRRRSGVDRTEAEREPARTMHLAWFSGSPGCRSTRMFASAGRFVKWNSAFLEGAIGRYNQEERKALKSIWQRRKTC